MSGALSCTRGNQALALSWGAVRVVRPLLRVAYPYLHMASLSGSCPRDHLSTAPTPPQGIMSLESTVGAVAMLCLFIHPPPPPPISIHRGTPRLLHKCMLMLMHTQYAHTRMICFDDFCTHHLLLVPLSAIRRNNQPMLHQFELRLHQLA